MRDILTNRITSRFGCGILGLLVICLGSVNLFAETVPPLPNADWFSVGNYGLAAQAIEDKFDMMAKGEILDVPGEEPNSSRIWPVLGDPEFGVVAPREQVKMSFMFPVGQLHASDNPMTKGVHEVSTKSDFAMWLTVQGKLRSYLSDRSDQWDPSITDYKNPSSRSIFNRGAAALGMFNSDQKPGFGYFPNVADLWIDADSLFRTSLYQDWQNSESATPQEPKTQSLENWNGNEEFEPWLNKWPNMDGASLALARGIPIEDVVDQGGADAAYANWYNDWWVANTQKGNFPWTGHG